MLRMVVVAMLVACGSGGDDTSPGVASGVAAREGGKVREISGKVTATHGSETRTLAAGYPVTADDMIDTGTDGSVVIELAHNNALWSLEAGIKARVDQSVAWGLSKQVAAKPVEHATSSAGRHADRQGADTQVTASESPKRNATAALPDPAAAAVPPPPPPKSALENALTTIRERIDNGDVAEPSVVQKEEQIIVELPPPPARTPTTTKLPPTQPPKDAKGTAPTAPTKPSDGCDEVSCMVNGGAPCCAKFRKSGAVKPAEKPDASLPETPDRGSIVNAMNMVKPKFRTCVEKSTAKGTIKVSVRVGPDGKVALASIQQPVEPALDACVLAAIKRIELPRSQNGILFTYPIVIH